MVAYWQKFLPISMFFPRNMLERAHEARVYTGWDESKWIELDIEDLYNRHN